MSYGDHIQDRTQHHNKQRTSVNAYVAQQLHDRIHVSQPEEDAQKPKTRLLPVLNHLTKLRKRVEDPQKAGPFFFVGGNNGSSILTKYCEGKGWKRIYQKNREDYMLKWCEIKSSGNYYSFKEGKQLLFQIPNNKVLTTKIGLLSSLRDYDKIGNKFRHDQASRKLKMDEFFPTTFRMDMKEERQAFFSLHTGVNETENTMWICKPTALNQGRGIFLLRKKEDIKKFQRNFQYVKKKERRKKQDFHSYIVQRYIQDPLLLEGRKFDVRSYLLVACTRPYMVFFRHGYLRLSCDPYDQNSNNLSTHLTNQYVQKRNPLYSTMKEETIWSMHRFNTYINQKQQAMRDVPLDWVFGRLTERMQEIMLQCFLSVRSRLERKLGFFDLIGCDFLIDENFKVWLLEMNCNPALHTNCEVLKEVIPKVVAETLDLTTEIFTKCCRRKRLRVPLAKQRDFTLLYCDDSPKLYRPVRSVPPALAMCAICGRASLQPAKPKDRVHPHTVPLPTPTPPIVRRSSSAAPVLLSHTSRSLSSAKLCL